jgi:hypothetical protein
MKRADRPRICWLVEHLPDIWLFAVVTPLVLALLIHAWLK